MMRCSMGKKFQPGGASNPTMPRSSVVCIPLRLPARAVQPRVCLFDVHVTTRRTPARLARARHIHAPASLPRTSVLVPAGPVDVAVGFLLLRRVANVDDLDVEVERRAGE